MNKELLNKILPYCGHGLKVAYEDNITDAGPGDLIRLCNPNEYGRYFKPVLFPPDCLNREIETEYGKETPLIELAKIACDYSRMDGWVISSGFCVEDRRDCLYPMIKSQFGYDGYKRFVKCIYEKDRGKEYIPIYNQWQLFQYLYSRHIAFNLEPDEYISVESLEKNPYAI